MLKIHAEAAIVPACGGCAEAACSETMPLEISLWTKAECGYIAERFISHVSVMGYISNRDRHSTTCPASFMMVKDAKLKKVWRNQEAGIEGSSSNGL